MSPTLSSRRLISDGEMPIFCADASMASTVKARRSNSGDVVFMVVGVEVALSAFEQVRGKVREKTYLCSMERKKKILFVCHGNICRSPMAEFIMKDLVRKAGLEGRIFIDSAAVSYEEQGNGIYHPAKLTLSSHNVPFSEHYAHRIDDAEASRFDLVVIMDSSNRRLISRLLSPENMKKVHMMMEYAGESSVRTSL